MSIGISESADTSPATSMPNASTSPVLALVYPAGKYSLQHCLCYSFILHYNVDCFVHLSIQRDKTKTMTTSTSTPSRSSPCVSLQQQRGENCVEFEISNCTVLLFSTYLVYKFNYEVVLQEL